jgi:hypothetical protein
MINKAADVGKSQEPRWNSGVFAYSGLGKQQRQVKQIPNCLEYRDSGTLTVILFFESWFTQFLHQHHPYR